MSCIDTHLPYFKELQTKLNVAAPVLKQILHKLQRDNSNSEITPEEVDLYLQGDSVEFGKDSLELYEQEYKEPLIVNKEDYDNALAQAKAVFPSGAVTSYQTLDGNYVIRVAEPTNSILKNAKRDADGRLLANNNEVSNLTEWQYVQVRTPQFKRWFGDWEKEYTPQTNIYKENPWEAYMETEDTGRTYVGHSGKTIPIIINKGIKYVHPVERITTTDKDPFGFNSYKVNNLIIVGKEVDADRNFNGICQVTANACKDFLKNRYNIESSVVIIRAKSPVKDDIINHWVNVLSINGEAYIYDMPQTEYIKQTKPLIYDGKELNGYYEGVIVSKYTPRLIKVTGENLSKFYKDNNQNDKQIQDIEDTVKILNRYKKSINLNDLQYKPAYNKNVSKVVDENGEPLVVYHGNRTDNKITTFDTSKKGTEHKERAISGFWFTTDKDIAKEEYALKPESRGKGIEYLQYGEVIPVFLNIKNPVETEQQGITVNDTPYGILTTAKEKLNDFINRSKALTRENTDGYILTLVDSDNRADDFVSKQIQLVVFNPNQIKSATSNTEFSTENNNIYKSEGPKLRRKNTWKELVKNNPVLAKLDAKNQAIVEKFIQQHLKEEAQGAIWRDVSSSYFDMNTNEHTPNRSVKDMLDYIYENTTDNQLKELIDILRPNITNEVNKLPIFYYNRSSSSARAFYEATDREIHVFRNAAFGSNKELARQNFERTMVHEIVHAMTVDYLSSNQEAREEIADIMNQLDNVISEGDDNLKIYALKNEKEFVSEFMSKPSLREALKHIPYQKGKKTSFFTKIVDAIKRLFGKKGTTVYDKASKLIDKILKDSAKYQGIQNEGRYNMETVSEVSSFRRENLATVKSYYRNAARESVQVAYEQAVEAIKRATKYPVYQISDYEGIEDYNARVDRIRKDIMQKVGWALDDIYIKSLSKNRGRLLIPKLKPLHKLVEAKLAMFDKWSSDELAAEALRLEQESSLNEAYYINPKKVPELKEQVAKRNPSIDEAQIDDAFQFLSDLENDPDLNKYVNQCITWLKNDTITLPRDHNKVISAFQTALKLGLDTQQFKSPVEVLIAASKHTATTPGTPIDATKIPQFHFNRTVETQNGTIEIYDVDDSAEGQQAVIDVLLQCSPKFEESGKPVGGSPWCLTTFTAEGKATDSAKNFWNTYNKGKRQIAILNGMPLAFNSSTAPRDEWWDFYDGQKNNRKGWNTIQQCDVESPKQFYTTNNYKISTITLGNHWYRFSTRGVIADIHNFKFVHNGTEVEVKSSTIYRNEETIQGVRMQSHSDNYDMQFVQGDSIVIKNALYRIEINMDKTNTIKRMLFDSWPIMIKFWKSGSGHIIRVPGMTKNTHIKTLDGLHINELYKAIAEINKFPVIGDTTDAKEVAKIKTIYEKLKNLADSVNQDKLSKEIAELGMESPAQAENTKKKSIPSPQVAQQVQDAVVTNNIVNAVETLGNTLTNTTTPQLQNNEYEVEIEQDELNTISEEINQTVSTDNVDADQNNSTPQEQTIEETDPITDKTIIDSLDAMRQGKLQQKYNEAIHKPIMKELEAELKHILESYHFELFEGDLKETFGEDVLGAIDFLQKVIYLAHESERNAITLPEEFAHAFIELMGGAYRRNRVKYPDSTEYSELRDLIEETSLYQQIYDEYKSTYTREDGSIDEVKIKKEAVGKALATALTDRFNAKTETDKSFKEKVKSWLKNILSFFKSKFNKEEELIRRLNKIADSILDGSYVKKYLTKLDDTGYKLTDFKESLIKQTQKDGGKTLRIIQAIQSQGPTLDGSLGLRAQGTIYRPEGENLHDLDFTVNPLQSNLYVRYPQLKYARPFYRTDYYTSERIKECVLETELYQNIKNIIPQFEVLAAYPSIGGITANCIVCDDADIVRRFSELTGSYSKRLSQFTQEERDQIHLIDLFFRNERQEIYTGEEGFNITSSDAAFEAKLKMGRAKDVYDYQRWNPKQRKYRITPSNVMYQKANQENTNQDIKNMKNQENTKSVEYTPIGKDKQKYTIEGTKIFNAQGTEVFKEDSKDRRKIFAKLALKENRAVVVNYRDAKYIVNSRGKILSVATGNFVWEKTPDNSNRKAIIELASKKFDSMATKPSTPEVNNSSKSEIASQSIQSSSTNTDITSLAKEVSTNGTTQQYNVIIDTNLKTNNAQWQSNNPNGIVAYRVNFNKYNTPEEANAGRIGNPFSENARGENTVEQFFTWLVTGENFGNDKATEEYRQAIINRILNTPTDAKILYYKELGRPSHATILGYLVNHKELLKPNDTNFYEGDITPDKDTIFVFGSNPEGRHGAGAARIAREQFGAVYGVGEGLTGNSYALPTKDLRVKENRGLRSIPKDTIVEGIKKLYDTARTMPDKKFKVAYRNTDKASLNGYTGLEMIDMFKEAGQIPSNIVFSKEWIDTGKITKEDFYKGEAHQPKEVKKDIPDTIKELSSPLQEVILNIPSYNITDQKEWDNAVSKYLSLIDKLSSKDRNLLKKIFEGSSLNDIPSTDDMRALSYFIKTGKILSEEVKTLFSKKKAEFEAPYMEEKAKTGKVSITPKEYNETLYSLREDAREEVLSKAGIGKEYEERIYGIESDAPTTKAEEVHEEILDTLGGKQDDKSDELMPETSSKVMSFRDELEDESNYLSEAVPEDLLAKVSRFVLSDGQFKLTETEAQEFLDYIDKAFGTKPEQEAPEVKQEKEKKQDKVLEEINIINEQFSRILDNQVLDNTDLIEVSSIIADMLSSKIDEMENNRDQVKDILTKRNPQDDTDINNLTRAELINALGIQHFINLVKQEFLKNRLAADIDTLPKFTEIIRNWDCVIALAKSAIYEAEGFNLKIDATGEKKAVEGKKLEETPEEDGTNIQDQIEDGQLSWQIENNTIDPVTSITKLVRQRFRQLYVLKDNGRKDKDGNILYDHVKTKWGTDAKVGFSTAAKCILNWVNSQATLKDMVKVLEEKAKKNPWVTQLLPILKDATGKYTIEQSQFFSCMYKPFMLFSTVGRSNNKIVPMPLNAHPFLSMAIKTIEAYYKLGQHPLISKGLEAGSKALDSHYTRLTKLMEDFENNKGTIFEELRAVSKGLGFEINIAELNLEESEVKELIYQLNIINNGIKDNVKDKDYDPFKSDGDKGSLRSNFMRFFEKITDHYEEEAVTSFYEGGKMRQSYLLPSFLTMFTNKFHLEDEAFLKFLEEEFDTEFMRDLSKGDIKKGWKNKWIERMVRDTTGRMRKFLKCKTSITFNNGRENKVYMKGMTKQEYALAMIAEFYGENSKASDSSFLANFRVPIESNKPSAEYITFYARGGEDYKKNLVNDFLSVFDQEISRIRTVILREKNRQTSLNELAKLYEKGGLTKQQYIDLVYRINQEAITNFDSRGKKFLYLDFLNNEVKNNTSLGKLILKSINGEKVDAAQLAEEASKVIEANIQSRVNKMISEYRNSGVFEQCKNIEKIGKSDEAVEHALEVMLWNDAFAATQIMQLLITDPAFLKNTNDIQKRFAQVHASGSRANIMATDFEGNPVSDGIHRSITLKDVDKVVSNIIENLTIAFNQKIEEAKAKGNNMEVISWEALKDKLVGEKGLYRTSINLTDAQAYSCPTSYRKKSFLFGLWSKEAEKAYKRIRKGNYTYSDVAIAFQPFKPFLYGNGIESTGVTAEGAMSKMRVSVQNKNAECLLIMADAILAGVDTGKPNLLRALFQVMEESHYDIVDGEKVYKLDGIDTVNFESAVKSGGQGRINTEAYEDGKEILKVGEGGAREKGNTVPYELAFKDQLRSYIYDTKYINGKEITTYNRATVKHLSFENYCMQQSVPEHFLDHSQLEGSQQRALMTSDLAKTTIDADGNEQTVYYEVGKDKVKMTADEIRERYDKLHADNIQKGIEEVEELFMLKGTPKERREALSKLLVDQFLNDGRYTADMLYMVTVNKETGDFPISLEDPSIRTQVEQAINSIVKSRVNKLKMKGGPLVQMSSFGLSRKLNIVFRGKDGKKLMTREEFESKPRETTYEKYIKENQKGIDHFEVIAPAYTEAIFKEFMDSKGNISVEALEALDPDLLRMIGYRIPTEAKYSIAPLKIVGFAPREMGDVIILPAEITLVNGSDFDVDKEYCIRKLLEIVSNIGLTEEEREKSKEEQELIIHDRVIGRLTHKLITLSKETNTKSNPAAIRTFVERFINNPYDKKLWMDEGLTEEQYLQILSMFVNIKYKVLPAKGRDAINNEIFDISYAVLTSEDNVAKALEPGGFEDEKTLAYAIEAYRNPAIRDLGYSFDQLVAMGSDAVSDLTKGEDKNLIFMDTQLEYYDRNNSASSLLGIAAVNSVAHAILVDDNIGISTSILLPTLAGFEFRTHERVVMDEETQKSYTVYDIRLDPSTDIEGKSVAKALGSCVGASADAAKDPVLNIMNLNPKTFNVYTTLVRIGVPKSIAGLVTSSSIMAKAISISDTRSLEGEWSTPEAVLSEFISKDTLDKIGYSMDSPLFSEEITKEDLVEGLLDTTIADTAIEVNEDGEIIARPRDIDLKLANFILGIYSISKAIRLPDAVTRFNSTSSAVGPSLIDNYTFLENLDELDSQSSLIDMDTLTPVNAASLMRKHSMLDKFSQAYDLVGRITSEVMPQTAAFFNSIMSIQSVPNIRGEVQTIGLPSIIRNDRSIMSKLREFYTAWLAVKKGVISYSELSRLSSEFPKTIASKKQEHSNNYLVQNLYLSVDKKSGFTIINMNISKIEKGARQLITAAWADLYAKDKEFALDLFKYSFFRGGIGFSPKTFMTVLPIQMKKDIKGYIDTFKNPEVLGINESNMLWDQFVRNNYMDNKLVPIKKAKTTSDGRIVISSENENKYKFSNALYIKIKSGKSYRLFKCIGGSKDGPVYRAYAEISKLGAEGNFLEINTNSNIEKSKFDIDFDQGNDGSRSLTPDVNDIPADRQVTIVEAKKLLDKLLTPEQQKAVRTDIAQKTGNEKQSYISRASAKLHDLLMAEGRTPIDEKVFNQMLKDLNLC